jgi:hypothetical protein
MHLIPEHVFDQSGLLSKEDQLKMEEGNELTILTPEMCESIIEEAQSKMRLSFARRLVCSVCDCLHPPEQIATVKFNDIDLPLFDKVLSYQSYPGVEDDPPSAALYEQYSLREFLHQLEGIFLSPRGVTTVDNIATGINICLECQGSLNNNKTPEYAIANGNFFGVLPEEHRGLNRVTYEMVNRCIPSMWIQTLHETKAKKLKSHTYFFRNNRDKAVAELLPRSMDHMNHVKCTVIGVNADVLSARAKEPYTIPLPKMWSLFNFLKSNNIHYRDIEKNPYVDQKGEWNVPYATIADGNPNDLIDGLDKAQEPRHHENSRDIDDQDDQIKIMMDIDSRVDPQEVMERLVIRRGNRIMEDKDPFYVAYCFAQLLPFGRGSPGEQRKRKWSLQKWVKYSLRLSHGHFAQDQSFILIMFDMIARHRAFQSSYLRVTMRPEIARNAAEVTREEMFDFCQYQDERIRAFQKNLPPPQRIGTRVASMFSGLTAGMSSFYGSAEERTQVRKLAYSTISAFGQPNIFFTICPDSFNNYQISSMNVPYPSIFNQPSVEEANELTAYHIEQINKVLTKAQMQKAATENPMNSAMYFDEILKNINENILSWDMERHQSKEKPGLFGYTSAFIGCVETQNSSNLVFELSIIIVSIVIILYGLLVFLVPAENTKQRYKTKALLNRLLITHQIYCHRNFLWRYQLLVLDVIKVGSVTWKSHQLHIDDIDLATKKLFCFVAQIPIATGNTLQQIYSTQLYVKRV